LIANAALELGHGWRGIGGAKRFCRDFVGGRPAGRMFRAKFRVHGVWVEMRPEAMVRTAAVLGFLGVALGAFGAHGLEHILEENDRVATWETAVLYHLVHAVALLGVGWLPKTPKVTVYAFAIGVVVFSGSLYVLSLTNISIFGFITMFGGISFLVGWLWLVVRPGCWSPAEGER
jgi:uncharacterized membrane protein YgdD (TMEM256/DUF423 family)